MPASRSPDRLFLSIRWKPAQSRLAAREGGPTVSDHENVRIAITGASGFIAERLARALEAKHDEVRKVSTRNGVRPEQFEGCDAVVHLAGEPVAQRWTAEVRERIRTSRVEGTRAVVDALSQLPQPPATLISASAVGYYGSRGDEVLTESSKPGDDFLARMAVEWEREAQKFAGRVVMPRVAIVIGHGGALKKMLPPFKLGVGGRIGDGMHWMSWIHVDDMVSLIIFLIGNPGIAGPVNASSPNPVRNVDFTRELAGALHRPAIFPVPALALKLMFGEMSEMVMASQRMVPALALDAGFSFRFPEIGAALRDVIS
jgi:uncharacterized protein